MKSSHYMCFLCAGSLLVAGCATQPEYSQAQLNAIETREVDASFDETFNAASGSLFDAGYTISMSDRQAGLLTGTKAKDRSADRFWVSPSIQDIQYAASIYVKEIEPRRSSVRIKTSKNGESRVNKEAIDEIWILMQRQVLMKEPIETAGEHEGVTK